MHNFVTSDTFQQKIGVIQGSICGPFFYDIHSKDLNYLFTGDEKNFCADELCLVFRGLDLDVLTDHINTTLTKVIEWWKSKTLAPNPS